MEQLTLLQEASHANLSAWLANVVGKMIRAGYGRKQLELSGNVSHVSAYLKIPPRFFHTMPVKTLWELFTTSETCGMTAGGFICRLPRYRPAIAEKDYLYLLPTPIARDWKDTPGMAKSKGARKRLDTFPRRIYHLENAKARTGIVNPALSLWLMGFPPDWLDNV